MKTESEIEALLHKTPTPKPTPQLAASLKAAVRLPQPANGSALEIGGPLWRRWFPALAYAVLILGCVVVLAVQNTQQQELIRQNEELRAEIAVAQEAADAREQAQAKSQSAARAIEQLQRDAAEAARLATRLAELQVQIDALNAQAKDLNAQLAAVPERNRIVAPYDFFGATNSPLNEARDKAARISCVNNMKQIGLALRIYANNHNDGFPPDLNSVSNELSIAKTLCCPADQASVDRANALFKPGGAGWAGWPKNGGSYEYRVAGLRLADVDPTKVVATKCRIHGQIGLMDGSVHQDPNYENRLRENVRNQP